MNKSLLKELKLLKKRIIVVQWAMITWFAVILLFLVIIAIK